ncbi:hypothetical protein SGUI_1895 [Serinicoccus hydrothermalis]|uniref:Asparagine synthetase n=1 Tax=Serinicoccus hydrothermalis TaxID=1758689 RepID=A0A1B1ND22_9MICO|nr:hypothetical protein [Serinicoccus hydrothermalis]ANS79291.1 hypothetical protein SGUI_1895 [Serinicoccus hydrothermalis]
MGPDEDVDEDAVLAGAHPHGYLLLLGADRDVPPPADVARWRSDADVLPGAVLRLHPRTVAAGARAACGDLVLLGHPVDVEHGLVDAAAIARRLTETWAAAGEQAMVREAAYLGGRFTLVARARGGAGDEGGDLLVVPDTMASQPVLVGRQGDRVAVASSPVLVADALGLPVDPDAVTLRAALEARMAGRVSYLPGVRTDYRDVRALLPNTLLRVTGDGHGLGTTYERFWPIRPRVENPDVDAVYADVHERLTAHVGLLAALGRPTVSLTGGLDSRVTAAVAAPRLRERDGFAFTYLNPREAVTSAAAVQDVLGARDVARQLGLRHRTLRWRRPPPGSTFDVLHRRTYAPRVPSRGAAYAMWADLPGDLVQLQSNGAEIATTYTKAVLRPPHELDPRWLTQIFAGGGPGAHDDLAEELYGDYLEQAPMPGSDLLGYDDHDLVYWEQRMGRWGWQKFCDGDLGHRVLLPFNDRVLLETMLSLPYPLRRDKVLFHRLVREAGVRDPATAVATTAMGTRTTPAPARAPALVRAGLVGRLRRLADRRPRQTSPSGSVPPAGSPTSPRGYALAPATAAPPVGLPDGFLRSLLPGRLELHRDPALPSAVSGGRGGSVLVLGDPLDLPSGRDGAAPVAALLHRLVLEDPTLERAATRAAALGGAWTVLLTGPGGSLVLTDPVGACGAWLAPDRRTLVSRPDLAGDGQQAEALGERRAVLSRRGPDRSWRTEALPDLGAYLDLLGTDARRRRERHVELLSRRGPALLCAGPRAGLLELGLPSSIPALTCWDPATEAGTVAMIHASDRAFADRRDVRVLTRAPGADWAGTLDREVGAEAVLWVGARPGAEPRRPGARALDLLQGVRRVALPWSDRVLHRLGGVPGPPDDGSRVRGDG